MTGANPSPYGPTWYAAAMIGKPERGALAHDLDADVCVVGGGLAGLTVAREIARRGWSVIVLEASRVAWGASGRNGGIVAPGFAEQIETIVERAGLTRAKELWALSVQGVEYIRAAIRDLEMSAVLPVEGQLLVQRVDEEDRLLRRTAMLRVDFGADIEAWPTDQVREVLRSPVYFQAMHVREAFHIDPLAYALGLAAGAEQAGARIFENSPALAIDPTGVRKRIETANGRVRAAQVVLAGGADLGSLVPHVAGTVVPVLAYAVTTAPLGEKLLEAIRYNGAVADTRRVFDYYRVVGDDRLLWGGRIGVRAASQRRMERLFRRDIRKVFPQLAGVELDHAWSGTMSYTVHRMPQIGEVMTGVWLVNGFGGHGLNTASMAGELIARAIVDGDDSWRLFSPYELVWTGGLLGRAATRIIIASMRLSDTVAERLARRREALRRRAVDRAAREAAQAARQAAEEAEQRTAEKAARLAGEEVAERLGTAPPKLP